MFRFSIKHMAVVIAGVILFFVIGRFIVIPSGVSNISISMQYGVLAFVATVFGPIAGLLTGLIGHFLVDASYGWGVWWSWVISSAVFGCLVGLFAVKLEIDETGFNKKGIILFNIVQLLANLIAWAVIAPVLDIVIYGEQANRVFVQGLASAGINTVTTAVIGTLLCVSYDRIIHKR